MKTIADLQARWWYRILKVLYIFGASINFISITAFLLAVSKPIELGVGLVIVAMLFQLFLVWFWSGVFYYIALGKFNPPVN